MRTLIATLLALAIVAPVADAHNCKPARKHRHRAAVVAVAPSPCAPCPDSVRVVKAAKPCTTIVECKHAASISTTTTINNTSPERSSKRSDFSFGVAALGSISDDVGKVEHVEEWSGEEGHHYGHYRHRHSESDDPDFYLTARAFADFYLDSRVRLFGNYDWDTRSDFEDGTFRAGASLDMLGTKRSVTKLSLYGGAQRSAVSGADWNGFAGGAAEHELVGPLGLLAQAEYDLGREVLSARAGATLRLY